jgi:hypothetical protein
MRLTYHPIDLKLKHPFRISRSVTEVKKNVIAKIGEGIGEAAPSVYNVPVGSLTRQDFENYKLLTDFSQVI